MKQHNRVGKMSSEYRAWISMKSRCSGNDNKSIKNYKNMGISVCSEWVNSFSRFLCDMGKKPFHNYSLDRIDISKGYSKDNCRWASRSIQETNKRPRGTINYIGVSFCKVTSKYKAQIQINKKKKHIGVFKTIKEAVNAYDEKYFKLYGC
jgi:hypothetical protein